jgi:hypothetical protein
VGDHHSILMLRRYTSEARRRGEFPNIPELFSS